MDLHMPNRLRRALFTKESWWPWREEEETPEEDGAGSSLGFLVELA